MSFRNWFKGAKAKALVVLGSFALLLGAGASVSVAQAAKENEVVETKASVSANQTIYLILDGYWSNGDERYAAVFNNTSNVWVDMTHVDSVYWSDSGYSTDVYSVVIPSGQTTNVDFCRMKKSDSANNWDNKWNDTGFISFSNFTKNTVKLTGWDNSTTFNDSDIWQVKTEDVIDGSEGTPSVFKHVYSSYSVPKPTQPSKSGHLALGVFSNSACTTAYSPTTMSADTTIYFKYASGTGSDFFFLVGNSYFNTSTGIGGTNSWTEWAYNASGQIMDDTTQGDQQAALNRVQLSADAHLKAKKFFNSTGTDVWYDDTATVDAFADNYATAGDAADIVIKSDGGGLYYDIFVGGNGKTYIQPSYVTITLRGTLFCGSHVKQDDINLASGYSDRALYNRTYTAPSIPTYESDGITFAFAGWFTDEDFETPYTGIVATSSFSLYAKFTDENTYDVTYQSVVDGILNPLQTSTISSVASGTTFNSLSDPVLYGHNFDGWFSDSFCTASLKDTYISRDYSLVYAKFTRISSNTTYYVDVTKVVDVFTDYIYVHSWNGTTSVPAPGLLLTAIADIPNLYSFSLPKDTTGFKLGLNNNNGYQKTVDLTPSGEHNLFVITTHYTSGSTKQNGEWKDVIYYLEGNASFTGDEATAWKSDGAIVMHEPTTYNGNAAEATGVSIAAGSVVKICMLFGDVSSASVGTKWYGELGKSYSGIATNDADDNIVFAEGVSGKFSFYLKNGVVYLENDANKTNYGYIYFSSSAASSDIFVTSYNASNVKVENSNRLSYISDEESTGSLTFNGVTGMHKISLYNLRGDTTGEYVKTVIFDDGTSTTTVAFTDDATGPVYYVLSGNSANNKNLSIAKEAKVAFDFDKAIRTATNGSVCNISQPKAEDLCDSYDKLVTKDYIEVATVNTYDYGLDSLPHKTKSQMIENGHKGPVSMTDIRVQLGLIAGGDYIIRTSLHAGPVEVSSPLTLTLWIVLGAGVLGLGAIGTAYFVSKKKRHRA